jgi:urea transporter/murein DD-endopeptidase MepM/ murein hydrolase activator NlpD
MRERIASFFRGCAGIFFLPSSLSGVVLVAITLVRPSMAVSGIIAVVAAQGLGWLIGVDKEFRRSAHCFYNPFLVGLSIGCRFDFCLALLLLAVLSGVLTMVLTLILARTTQSARLPILSLPFAIASPLLYLAISGYWTVLGAIGPAYTVGVPDLALPLWLAAFFRSFGAMLFFPSVVAGILVAALVLLHSRVLFVLAVLGFYAGVFVHSLFLPSLNQSYLDINNFNFVLIAMALGAVFLVPSFQSCLLALIGVAVSAPVLEAFAVLGAPYGIPPFTWPYCLVTLGALYSLRMVNSPLLSTGLGRNPEEIRENLLVNRSRYRGNHRTLYLPFSGKWTVMQGFNGRWTHQGLWQYAYDFLITDEDGKTHRGEGDTAQDYYCYRKPVLAPVRGQVVRVVDYQPDNPIGTIDRRDNWGNLVMLRDTRGFYVEISHFTPGSVRPKVGEWVERGSVLGLCGNSGYSPEPHVHVQVQVDDVLGAATAPFSFVSYRHADSYHANDVPAEGDQVEPLYPEKRLDEATGFLLGDKHEYEIFRHGREMGKLKLCVGVAPDGCYYFESPRAKLYFGKHEGTFYMYRLDGNDPYLRLLFMAMPRLPLTYKNSLNWCDYVPLGVAATGMRRGAARLATFLHPNVAKVKVTQTFRGTNCVESVLESRILGLKTAARLHLDDHCGFASVQVGNVELRRSNPGNGTPASSPVFPIHLSQGVQS